MTPSPSTPRRTWRSGAALIGLFFIAACGALVTGMRRYRLPAPTGPYAVGTRVLNLTDPARAADGELNGYGKRQLVVQLWYPAANGDGPTAPYRRWRETRLSDAYKFLIPTNSHVDAPAASTSEPFHILLFGPRWAGERTQNTALAEELASHGYVVAAIDHPYNASRVLLGDGTIVSANPPLEGRKGDAATADERIAYWNHNLGIWTADGRFVLDQLAALNADPSSDLHGRLDTDHAGAFGHSFGGAASLALCGLDPRIHAAVNLDGWTFAGLAHRTAEQSILLAYEQISAERQKELAATPHPGTVEDQLDRADNAQIDPSLKNYGGFRLFVAGAQHLDFTDQPLLPPFHRGSFTGPISRAEVNNIVRAYVLDFFNQALRNRPSSLLETTRSPFVEVTQEIHPATAKDKQ